MQTTSPAIKYENKTKQENMWRTNERRQQNGMLNK
jgi:hypothetical protein